MPIQSKRKVAPAKKLSKRVAERKAGTASAPQLRSTPIHDLFNFARRQMQRYSKETNENRAIPEYRDGCKPVSRKLLWGAKQVAQTQCKSARLIGHVIGTLHPHGDIGTYDAASTMVNCGTPIFDGVGNWGSLLDSCAAMRYTELKLPTYGRQFLDPRYLAVTPMCPNYDDRATEPIILPALLPNILLNSTFGIGLTVTTHIPAFTPPSLLGVMVRLLNKEALAPADYAKALKFHEPWGGKVANNAANRAAILQLMESPSSAIVFTTPLIVDEKKKQIVVDGAAPRLNLANFVVKARRLKGITSVESQQSKVSYTIQCSRSLTSDGFEGIVSRIRKMTTTRMTYSIYVTDRSPLGDGKYEVNFHRMSVQELIMTWLRYRVRLEIAALKNQIGAVEGDIHRLNIMILACDNLKIIFDGLKRTDTQEYISKGLKITMEDAGMILDLPVRRLSALDKTALQGRKKKSEGVLKSLNKDLKHPDQAVKRYLELCIAGFKMSDSRYTGCYQWYLTLPANAGAVQTEEEAEV